MPSTSTILDHRGHPIRRGELTRTHAAPSIASVRQPIFDEVMATLTPAIMVGLLRASAQGDVDAYLTLAEEMEERDLHYAGVMQTRKLSVTGITPIVVAKKDDAESVALQDEVREVLIETPHFVNMLTDVLDAIGKGYSVVEINWRRGAHWVPVGYDWRDPRWFLWDQDSLSQLRLRTEKNPAEGEELAPYKFIVHRHKRKSGLALRGGIARLAAVAFMFKGYSLKDWMAFAEVFGMPIRVGKYGPGATEEDRETLQIAVANIGTDAAAVMPDSMAIEFVDIAKQAGGERIFGGLADWLDRQVSKAVLGQTMTTDDGSSLAQAKVHNDVRLDIVQSDAMQLSNAINRDLVKPYIDLNHGPREEGDYPRVEFAVKNPEDLKAFSDAVVPLIDRGLLIEVSAVRDKFGFDEPEEGAEVLSAKVSAAPEPKDDEDEDGDKDKPEDKKKEKAENAALHRSLVKLALNRGGASGDEVDKLMAQLADEDWQELMDPVLDPIANLLENSSSFEAFDKGLEAAMKHADSGELARTLAIALYKIRGYGDGTDRP